MIAKAQILHCFTIAILSSCVETSLSAPQAHQQRQMQLLHTMRTELNTFHILEKQNRALEDIVMHDFFGNRHLCQTQLLEKEKTAQQLDDDEDLPTEYVEEASSSPSTASETTLDISSRLDFLSATCREIKQGWWQYKWCHSEEVVQYHAQPDGTTSGSGSTQSLGKFNALATQEYNEKLKETPTTIKKESPMFVHIFDQGDVCSESGVGRSTQVEFWCCPIVGPIGKVDNLASAVSIVEPSTCIYTLKICTQYACSDDNVRGSARLSSSISSSTTPTLKDGKKQEGERVASIKSLLKPLGQSCFRLQDGWWVYELCLGQQLRQFHLEKNPNGGNHLQTQIHILGKQVMPMANNAKGDKKYFVQAEGDISVMSGSTVAYEHVYTSGDMCEISGQGRTAAIHYVCSDPSVLTSRLIKVMEVETCRYVAIFHTPYLCDHPAFSKEVEKVVEVSCHK